MASIHRSFTALAAGEDHACGLAADGRAFFWGIDDYGQLGTQLGIRNRGELLSYAPVPVDVSGINPPLSFSALKAGSFHTCGLATDGRAFCWGWDLHRQLGNGEGAPNTCFGSDFSCSQSPVLVGVGRITPAEPLVVEDEMGNKVMPSDYQIDEAIKKWSEIKARNMSETINDQLTADEYKDKQKEQIKSGIRYGTGFVKGPVTESYTENETIYEETERTRKALDFFRGLFSGEPIEEGRWTQIKKTKYYPVSQALSIWNCFPDMSATELSKCNFFFELNSMTKHDFRALAKREDFFSDVIYEILRDNPRGNYRVRSWECFKAGTNA